MGFLWCFLKYFKTLHFLVSRPGLAGGSTLAVQEKFTAAMHSGDPMLGLPQGLRIRPSVAPWSARWVAALVRSNHDIATRNIHYGP